MTDVPPDPTEPAPTDLLDFPPLPQQSRPADHRDDRYRGVPAPSPSPAAPGAGPRAAAAPPGSPSAAPTSRPGGGSRGAGPSPFPSAAAQSGLRVVPEAEATARLRIKLPTTMPTPSTALRPQAVWEDTHEAEDQSVAAPFAQVKASPASPVTLPSQLAAMTTATMVIPLPPSLRPSAGLLTTTLPPDQAAQANAARIGDAFRDTIEEIFGVDLDTVDPAELGLSRHRRRHRDSAVAGYEESGGYHASADGYPYRAAEEFGGYQGHDRLGASAAAEYADLARHAEDFADQSFPPIPPSPWPAASGTGVPDLAPTVSFPRPVPAEVFGGAYGVPTQQAPFPVAPGRLAPFGQGASPADPARHALALRYLGGIFHDSSGESSYLDPEEVDQGWIPSAFGAAPPDAPTERIARIPAEGNVFGPGPRGAAAGMARPRPQPVADPSAPPAPSSTASSATSSAPPAGHGRSGSRTARASRPTETGAVSGAGPANASSGTGNRRKRPAAPAPAAEPAEGRKRSRALTVTGLCIAACAVLYGLALLLSGNVAGGAIPRGTTVAGVSIGGLSPADARATLERELGPLARRPVSLLVGQTPIALDPAKSGLSFDVDATLAQAESQRTNPFTIIPALFGVQHDYVPVTDTDDAALTAALNTVAASYDTPLVEGKITFADGKPVVTAPRQGRGFDVPTALAAIGTGYMQISGPIVLPVSALDPLATPDALQAALEQIARPAMSAPVTVDTGGVLTVLTPTQLGAALTIAPNQDGTMVPTLDGDLLRADLNHAASALEQPGADAAFTLDGGKPQLVPERDGVGFSAQALSAAVGGVLTSPAPRNVSLHAGPLPPAFTTADAQALGITSVLGSATLPVPDAPDRAADTQRATGLVAGSVVAPGAVWSFNKTVGPPTLANGFNEVDPASARAQGVDLSGGDDLVATAVFDAAFRAGLGDTVHHPNAAYFSRYPVGLDAAVVWPGTDLQWTNTSSHPVYLYAAYTDGQLTVAVLSQPSYDQVTVTVSDRTDIVPAAGTPRPGCPAQPGSDGFQVNVTRVLLRGGAQVGTEEYHVAYLPFAGTTCGSGTGSNPPAAPNTGASHPAAGGAAPTHSGGSGSGQNPPPPPPSSAPAPAPSSGGGELGGLLH